MEPIAIVPSDVGHRKHFFIWKRNWDKKEIRWENNEGKKCKIS